MVDIWLVVENDFSLKIKWKEFMECIQFIVRNRFFRFFFKDKLMQVMDFVSEEEIDFFKRYLREFFLDMNIEKLQKVYIFKVVDYNEWLEKYIRQCYYCFQICKCEDCSCCLELQNKNFVWLLDLVLDELGDYYFFYSLFKFIVIIEDDRFFFKKLFEI